MSNKDWLGNNKSIFTCLGASNHTIQEREENDFYATEPKAVELLLECEVFNNRIWECACGDGSISKVLESHGYDVYSSDLIYRGYGDKNSVDFLKSTNYLSIYLSIYLSFKFDIITNPPYKFAAEFVETALELVKPGSKVAMFLKLQFLEGKQRKELFKKYPPKVVYVSSSRLICAKNGDFSEHKSSAVAYAWFVWEKGFKGNPIIKWIN